LKVNINFLNLARAMAERYGRVNNNFLNPLKENNNFLNLARADGGRGMDV
jgi:hypothetical protein